MMVSNFQTGKEIVKDGIEIGLEKDCYFRSLMIDFSVKVGEVDEARRVFD